MPEKDDLPEMTREEFEAAVEEGLANEKTHAMLYGTRSVYCIVCGTRVPWEAPCSPLSGDTESATI